MSKFLFQDNINRYKSNFNGQNSSHQFSIESKENTNIGRTHPKKLA
jgi:hypothetical protein